MSAEPETSPTAKRIKLEYDNDGDFVLSQADVNIGSFVKIKEELESETEVEEDCCTICLQPLVDRAVISTCSHEFCFECLVIWTGSSFFILFVYV